MTENESLQSEYAPLYNNDRSLNVAEALSRLRYWTGEASTADRPHAKAVISLLIKLLEIHLRETQ
jgi:hypothetical protein